VIYRFNDYELDTARFELRRAGTAQSLEPQVLRLLLHLVENRHRVVTRAELFETIWQGRIVADAALYSRIKSARAAIGDQGPTQALIRTVSRTGYQFVADVDERPDAVAAEPPAAGAPARGVRHWLWAAAVSACIAVALGYMLWTRIPVSASVPDAPHLPAIAVLPFVDMSPNGEQDKFADGLTEELTDQLTQIPGVRVAGRTSAFSFKGKNEDLRKIANAMGVGSVLEGSVRRSGDRLRITTQLIDASGKHIWSRTYDRERSDVFSIQQDVARNVAAAFSVTVSAADAAVGPGGTRNQEAYAAYLSARATMIEPGIASAQDVSYALNQLERAVALDPKFAMAWTWLALSYVKSDALPEKGSDEWKMRARQAVAHARAIAPDLPWVLVAESLVAMQDLRWAEAERFLARARAAASGSENPYSCSGCLYLLVGRPHEALKNFQRARIIEPALAADSLPIALALLTAGELDEAHDVLSQTQAFGSGETLLMHHHLTQALAMRDRAGIIAAISRMPETDELHHRMLELLDDREAALAELRRLKPDAARSGGFWVNNPLGLWAAYFGDPELALTFFEASTRDSCNTFLLWNPLLKDMRRLPRFKTLVSNLKLVDYWRSSGTWNEFCQPRGEADFECT
jgi:TolB-like protein/DNA-binding winged helix-turn-helix (wHTH) protein/tetratricopeptide (TPR) repeat protein